MSRYLVLALALFGCESNLITNEPLPPVDSGVVQEPSTGTPRDASTASVKDAQVSVPAKTDSGAPDAAAPIADASVAEVDAGSEVEVPAASVLAGSALASSCSSYGAVANGTCAGFFCGVTAGDIAAELESGNLCGLTAEQLCSGQLSRDVAKCAREVRTNFANALDSVAQLRMKIQACIQKVQPQASAECLGCYIDGAQCASDKCITQCLTGDSPTCDKCRTDNQCNQPVYGCVGLPSPF